jgi:hypothetical protein
MDRLEQALREDLARQVRTAPQAPGLAERAVTGARRSRRTRVALGAAAVVATVGGVVAVVPPLVDGRDGPPAPAAQLDGPPRIAVLTAEGDLVDWGDGVRRQRTREIDVTPIAAVPDGVVAIAGDPGMRALTLLFLNGDSPQGLADAVLGDSAAVSADGKRAAVMTGTAGGARQLVEVRLSDSKVLRTVPLAPPLVSDGELARPVAYSDDRVLLSIGDGPRERAAIWEPGDDHVIGVLDGFAGTLDGSHGRGAFLPQDPECSVEVTRLRDGASSWRACGNAFAGLSPDGEAVLEVQDPATLVVLDADDGKVRRRIGVPADAQSPVWESEGAVLYASPTATGTEIVRCSVDSGVCATAATLPETSTLQLIAPH